MPRFYLHIKDGGRIIPDPDGIELPTVEAARREAIASAQEILAEKLKAGDVVDGQEFDICDEAGNVIERVPFRSVIKLPGR
jgi:hypothetical protein